MAINTLADVQMLITTLDLTDCLWHADDDAVDCLSHLPAKKAAKLGELMREAIAVCEKHNTSIWDYYPDPIEDMLG